MAPGEIPGWKSAPFRKLDELKSGPGVLTVKLMAWMRLPTMALITTGPGVGPAVTVADATPFASVRAGLITVAEPDATWKVTDAPGTARPCASVTRTEMGCANACPMTAD